MSTGKANAMFIASFNMGFCCYMHVTTSFALYIYIKTRSLWNIYEATQRLRQYFRVSVGKIQWETPNV